MKQSVFRLDLELSEGSDWSRALENLTTHAVHLPAVRNYCCAGADTDADHSKKSHNS